MTNHARRKEEEEEKDKKMVHMEGKKVGNCNVSFIKK